jgi:hypothetical protein
MKPAKTRKIGWFLVQNSNIKFWGENRKSSDFSGLSIDFYLKFKI